MHQSMKDIVFVSVGHHRRQNHREMAAHSHPFNAMIALLQGARRADMRETVTTERTGNVLLYPPNAAIGNGPHRRTCF